MKTGGRVFIKELPEMRNVVHYAELSGTLQEIATINNDSIILNTPHRQLIYAREYELIPEELENEDDETIKLYFAL